MLVREQFPAVPAERVTYLGEGCDSRAYEVDREWVFRFPKREDVEQQLHLEARVLPVLNESSPLQLPAFRFHGRPSDTFPRHFVGYQKLPGEPAIRLDPSSAPPTRWAPALGRFFSWLHQFPRDTAERLGVGVLEVRSFVEALQADALRDFDLVGRVAPDAPLEEWRAFLMRAPDGRLEPCEDVIVHGDFAAEHVLWDSAAGTVTGVIDWSEIAIGSAAVDIAGLFHWGGRPVAEAVLASYSRRVDEASLRCAQFLAACRGVGDIAFGCEAGRRDYVDAGVRALGLCAGDATSAARTGGPVNGEAS